MSDIEVVEPLAVGTVPNVAPDQPITSAWGNTVADTINGRVLNVPACRVYHNAVQSVINNSGVPLAFNTERFDTDAMHDTAASNTRLTIKTAGLYYLSCSAEFADSNDYTVMSLWFQLNGSIQIAKQALTGNGPNWLYHPSLHVNTAYEFAVNDYVEVVAFQINAASAARNVVAFANRSPELVAVWVGNG